MGKLRKLQERYLKGELTKAQYEAECKKLLDDEILDQDAYDDALDYDPDYERPKSVSYTHLVAVWEITHAR